MGFLPLTTMVRAPVVLALLVVAASALPQQSSKEAILKAADEAKAAIDSAAKEAKSKLKMQLLGSQTQQDAIVIEHSDHMYGLKDCSAAVPNECDTMMCMNENCECVDCAGYPGITCETATHKEVCEERDNCQWRSTEAEGDFCVWAAPVTLSWEEHSDGYQAGVAGTDTEIFDCSDYMGNITTCPLFDVTELYLQLDVDYIELKEIDADGNDGSILLSEPKSASYDDDLGYTQADFNTVMGNNPFENAYKGWGFVGQASTSKMSATFTRNAWVSGEGFKVVVKCYPCGWFEEQAASGTPYTTLADPQKYCTAGEGRTPDTFYLRNDYQQPVAMANLRGYDTYDPNMNAPDVDDGHTLDWQHYLRKQKTPFASFDFAYNTMPPQFTTPCA